MPAGEGPGLRELKKLATREAVRAAAVRLAVRDGIENVTVERIAEAAEVSLRTFFNHFSSKEDAVFAAAESRAAELVAEFRRRPGGESPLQALREAAMVVLDRDDALGRDHLAALRLLRRAPSLLARQMVVLTEQEDALAAAAAERFGTAAAERFGTAAAERLGTDDGRFPQLWAAVVLAALRIALDRWLAESTAAPDPGRLRAEIDDALTHLAGGLDPRT
ncbi:TetR/AcrR family transcriptional regulator [Pseudonocardia sp. KRD291]|uniref:TetR/AcrR family transcriptional regulator n=1 Tax=Pseudonocardia sp. KRD291 TaxID=2792007 RepID=UPI001C4A0C5D|nr:TetR/AcrR family transcriptional regulator [Pseudonocardia sp. KRD291]